MPEFERPDLAPPGISGELWAAGGKSDEEAGDPKKVRDPSPREFALRCTLRKHERYSDSITFDLDPTTGESFLKMPAGRQAKKLGSTLGGLEVHRNSNDQISGFSATIRATSPPEAKSLFLARLSPLLDFLAYQCDCPLAIDKVLCEDATNTVFMVGYTSPYPDEIFDFERVTIREQMAPIYALYREAKNSTSAFYRCLCYYKIMEGVFRHVRPQLFEAAEHDRISIKGASERVPDLPEIRKHHPGYIGKKIKPLFETELTDSYRDEVAHYVLDTGALLNPSDWTTQAKFSSFLFLVETSCRVVMANQEQLFDQYFSGTPNPTGSKAK